MLNIRNFEVITFSIIKKDKTRINSRIQISRIKIQGYKCGGSKYEDTYPPWAPRKLKSITKAVMWLYTVYFMTQSTKTIIKVIFKV